MTIQVVILAAGQGKRMNSHLPKMLHHLAGKPLLQHVMHTVNALLPECKPVIIVGHQSEKIKEKMASHDVQWTEQKEQLGTGHALQQALPYLDDKAQVLILCGDTPLISQETLTDLIKATPDKSLGMLTAVVANPRGYGRIQRDAQKNIQGIVEEKDANDEQKKIQEINPGVYLVPVAKLKQWLPELKNDNQQKEYYLTDMIALAVKDELNIHSVQPHTPEEILGINDRMQLAMLERLYQKQQAEKLMQQGVTLYDPLRFDVRGEVQVGRDVVIDINVILENKVIIGDECTIGANCILRDTILGNRVTIKPNTILDGALVEADCVIGPFARIRPDTILAEKVTIGNFVEVKKSRIGTNTKINHLSYIGDSEVGHKVNIGAGTITCNYDGINKHKTIIEDYVFIGSCSQLVAPVVVGKCATVGAGSTITENVPPNALALSRVRQQIIQGWERPVKKKE